MPLGPRKFPYFFCCLVASSGLVGLLPAASVIVPNAPESGSQFIQGSTQGWSFIAIEEIEVTSLGTYDFGGNGLIASHKLTLWDAGGNPLAAISIGSGSHILQDGFVYQSLAGTVILKAGESYTISDYIVSGAEIFAVSASGNYLIDPVIAAVDDRRFIAGDQFPDQVSTASSIPVGAGFEFRQVPEPSTWLLALGAGLLAWRRRR